MGKRVQKKKGNPLLRVLKAVYISAVVLAVVIVAGFAAYNVFIGPPDVAEEVTFPIAAPTPDAAPSDGPDDPADTSRPAKPAEDVVVYTRQKGVYTCLLLGVADIGGSDSIMLGCFDTNNKTASLISIPRDTLVVRNGKNGKLNAVYSDGGSEAMADQVSSMLGVPVDYWMSVNIKAFRKIVDAIDGVEFDVPVNMNYEDPTQNLSIHIKKGYQRLNGKQAEGVVRCRSCYPNADLGRAETQRAFLKAMVSQTITASNVDKVTELIGILQDHVKTNMKLEDMIYFATTAVGMDLDEDLAAATLPGKWKSPYEETDDAAALKMVNEMLPVYTQPITADIMNIHHR